MSTSRPQPWLAEIGRQLEEVAAADRFRHRRTLRNLGAVELVDATGQRFVSFASNDYLGLGRDPRVCAGAIGALERYGAGAGAARLVTGTRPIHEELEAALADWKHTEAALVFSSGYLANLGVLTALGGRGVTIVSDELNHASIIDGARLARAEVAIYHHLDLEHLALVLGGVAGRAIVVSEAVFSMDGDIAPVPELARCCAMHDALLVLDEAHSLHDEGAAAGRPGCEVVHVGTLSKSLGSLGGFVAGSAELVSLIENRARSFVFTTGLSPADTGAAFTALAILRSPEGASLVARLDNNVAALLPGHPSPIVPFVLGEERAALLASEALERRGLYVPAIRPPTVPPGTSRLRCSLSAAHSMAQIAALREALEELEVTPVRSLAAPKRRDPRVIAVVGTGTDVGKTHVAEGLLRALAPGYPVAARKPLQSYTPGSGPTDAERLAAASGERPGDVCPTRWSYPKALAPPIAARALGRRAPSAAEVVSWLEHSLADLPNDGVAIVELVGGIASPHTRDGDGRELLRRIAPDLVVLVAPSGLGALNDLELTTAALRTALPGTPTRVVLNRFDSSDETHATNFDHLYERAMPGLVVGDEKGLVGFYDEVAALLRIAALF